MVGYERRGGDSTSDSDVSFQQSFTSDDKLQVCGNRLPGYEKPSITISVIISSWPRPIPTKLLTHTHIILLKEIEKCIPDCQRKEFPMIYTKMFLEHFSSTIHLQEILKTNIS